MSKGYLLIGLGKPFIDECTYLVSTLRKQKDTLPVTIIVLPEERDYAMSSKLFDSYIELDVSDPLYAKCVTDFERYCLYPKLILYKNLPYTETIFLDCDILCQRNPAEVWEYFKAENKPLVFLGKYHSPFNYHRSLRNMIIKYGKHIPYVHTGIFYITEDSFLNDFFEYCKYAFDNYENFGCVNYGKRGKNDEPLFAIAHSHFNMKPIEFDKYGILTFNTRDSNLNLPTKVIYQDGNNTEKSDYIPFIHVRRESHQINPKIFYERLMEK